MFVFMYMVKAKVAEDGIQNDMIVLVGQIHFVMGISNSSIHVHFHMMLLKALAAAFGEALNYTFAKALKASGHKEIMQTYLMFLLGKFLRVWLFSHSDLELI